VVIFASLLYIPLSGWFINYKAWTRDLFPADKRGQFSGFTLLFAVLLPMISGPFIGSWLTTHYGLSAMVNNQPGFIPTPLVFQASAVAVLLALIPLFFTKEMRASRIEKASPTLDEAESQTLVETVPTA
jgi:MFS family permease